MAPISIPTPSGRHWILKVPTVGTKIMTPEGEKILTSGGYQPVTPELESQYPSLVPVGTRIMTSEGGKIMTAEGYKLVTPELESQYPSLVPVGTRIMTSEGGKIMTAEGYKPFFPIETINGLTVLRLSDAERQKLATLREQATCPGDAQRYEPRIFKAMLRDGGYVFVEATTNEEAKARAKEAGYNVMWATWWPRDEETKPRVLVSGVYYPYVETLTGDQIPEEWRDATSIEKEALGLREVGGKWTVDVVNVGGEQVMPKKTFDVLPEEQQTMALTKGYDAMLSEYYVQVQDGKTGKTITVGKDYWEGIGEQNQSIVKNDGLAALETKIESDFKQGLGSSKYLSDAYESGGIEGYNKAVKEYNDVMGTALLSSGYAWNDEFTKKYIAMLQPAGVSDTEYDKIKPYISSEGINVDQFIYDNPTTDAAKLVSQLGFDQDVVDACNKYVGGIQDFVLAADSMEKATSPWRANKYGIISKDVLDRAYLATDVVPLAKQLKQYQGSDIDTWHSLSDADKIKVAGYYVNDPFSKNPFASAVADIEVAKGKLSTPLQWGLVAGEIGLFIVAPEIAMPLAVTRSVASLGARASVGQKVGGMDIALTAAMATAAVLPYIGPVVARSLGTAGKIGLATTSAGITGFFLVGSVPTILSKDVPLYDRAAAILFDAMMVRGLGRMVGQSRKVRPSDLTLDLTPQQRIEVLNRILKPVSGLTVEERRMVLQNLQDLNMGITDLGVGERAYQVGKKQYVSFIDAKTIKQAKEAVRENYVAYNTMMSEVGEYANTQLKLKEVQRAIADFGLAKSKSQLRTLEIYKAREAELSNKLRALEYPMVEAVSRYTKLTLKNAKGLTEQEYQSVREEIEDMPKSIVRDIDSMTTQLFEPRKALVVAKDIKELSGQIGDIEGEIKRGMTAEQVAGCEKLVGTLKSQINDLVEEVRLRYLTEGEKVSGSKKLTMEVQSLQQRLEKAVQALEDFKKSALNYPVYKKGELVGEAEVVKAERDIMEAIQRTTEAVWGKESYSYTLGRLNEQLDSLVSLMRKANVSTDKAVKVSFDLYDAIKKQDAKALKEGVRLLQLETGKIKETPLLLKAAEEIKLLGITADDLMARFKYKPKATPKVSTTGEGAWWEGEVGEESRIVEIKRDVERIIQRRFEELARNVPDYVQRRGSGAVMDYLRKTVDEWYFKDKGFDGMDDYLDPNAEIERLYQKQLDREREWERQQNLIKTQEFERDMAKKRLIETTNPARKETLSDHVKELDRSIEKQKIAFAEALKMKMPLREIVETTKTPGERKQAITTPERGLAVTEKTTKERIAEAKSAEKATKEIRTAKKELERESGFPGITSKKTEGRPWVIADYRTQTTYIINKDGSITRYDHMTGTQTSTRLSPAVKVSPAIRTAVKEGLQTYVQTLTQLQTQTQAMTKTQTKTQIKTQTQTRTRTAVKTAVQTALKKATKTITKTDLQRITRLITTQITRIPPPRPPIIRPPRMQTILSQPREKIHEGPALATWKQGIYWVSIFPPFRTTGTKPDVVYSRHKPPLASVIAKGRHAPRKTLRSIGRVPSLIELPMGVVTARIRNGRNLTFSRRRVNGRKRRAY